MTDDQHAKDPSEAHREGLERLEHAPHHPTTEHDKAPHQPSRPVTEPPGEQHRGGPLPYQKR
ncbi:MAG TPA: hypothetical protein VGC96_04490 [Candidatus Elarobacter sp.]|jgi:hypothetical protein